MTADVVGLYPNIPHSESLDTFKKQYKNCPNKKVSAEDIGKMVDFVLQNNLFSSILRLLERSLPLHMLVFLWTTLSGIFKDTRILEEIY